jgi:hypothetical protein
MRVPPVLVGKAACRGSHAMRVHQTARKTSVKALRARAGTESKLGATRDEDLSLPGQTDGGELRGRAGGPRCEFW